MWLQLALLSAIALGAEDAPTEPEEAVEVADPVAEVSKGPVCLADGQVLESVRVVRHPDFRTVRVGEVEVRVPEASLGEDCTQLRVGPYVDPLELRTLVLIDGQHLHGTPRTAVGTVTLALLDGHFVHVPDAALESVQLLDRDVSALAPLRQEAKRRKTRNVLGISASVGLGVLGAALIGGVTYGAVAAGRSPEPAR